MKTPALVLATVLLAAACSGLRPAAPASGLTLASWNTEHLAERNGTGCRPRSDADYAAMRAKVAALHADVIAFEEVESKAAAERVFDPALYTVLVEERTGTARTATCGRDAPDQVIRAQRTGLAIRKGLPFERQPDLTALQLGDPDLRSAVDVILRPHGAAPLRVLAVHLKSGCSAGDRNAACPVLFAQVPVLESWIDARAREPMRFAVMGDFNRRLAVPRDPVWAALDDGSPPDADLTLAAGNRGATCEAKYPDFIDHIVLDRRAAADLVGFDEVAYDGPRLSDHCPITARLR